MKCNCEICKRQHKESQCIKKICKYFNWKYDIAPSQYASNYEDVMHESWEYLALCHNKSSHIRYWNPTYGSGVSQWLYFNDFLYWLSLVKWFVPSDYDEIEFLKCGTWLANVENPFYRKYPKSIEEVNIILDLNSVI